MGQVKDIHFTSSQKVDFLAERGGGVVRTPDLPPGYAPAIGYIVLPFLYFAIWAIISLVIIRYFYYGQ